MPSDPVASDPVASLAVGTAAGRAGLAALLTDPRRAALVLDFDGTLSPIVDDPEQATIHPAARDALIRVAPHVGSVAILTGRPAAVVVNRAYLSEHPALSRLVVLGLYGSERWDAATRRVEAPPPAPGVAAARTGLAQLLAGLALPSGVTVEDKGGSLAVHTRRSSDPAGALAILEKVLPGFAAERGLIVEPGRLVLELRPPGVDKGAALRAFVAERSARSVTYAGDDLGDLPAFAAVEDLRREGVAGLKICSGSAEVIAVAQRADLIVPGPPGVAEFLTALADRFTPELPTTSG